MPLAAWLWGGGDSPAGCPHRSWRFWASLPAAAERGPTPCTGGVSPGGSPEPPATLGKGVLGEAER